MPLFGQIPSNSALNIQSFDINVATAGGSLTIADATSCQLLDPAGLIATFTITMAANPANNILRIISTKAVSLLTVNANSGQSIVGAPTAFLAGGYATFVYVPTKSTWYRCS